MRSAPSFTSTPQICTEPNYVTSKTETENRFWHFPKPKNRFYRRNRVLETIMPTPITHLCFALLCFCFTRPPNACNTTFELGFQNLMHRRIGTCLYWSPMCRCTDVTDHRRIGAQYEQVPNVTTVFVFSHSIIIFP